MNTLSLEILEIPVVAENEALIPTYTSEGAAGADARSALEETVTLRPGETKLIPTGLRVAVPVGYELQVRPRSGLALKQSVTVLNTPGTVDSDYRGEVGVILINHGSKDFEVTPGMRIAQFVIAPVLQARFVSTTVLGDTVRGSGGFGHSGTN